jgi:acyl-CoA thioester hydrolase
MIPGKTYEYQFTVTDDMLDDYKHVNNARYLEVYEKARWDILEKNGLGRQVFKETGIGPVIHEITIRFSRELLPGELITIKTSSRKKNELIYFFDQVMINAKGQISSKATFTSSLFDMRNRKMVKFDERWLKAIGF